MSQDYTINWVGDRPRQWRHQEHGAFTDYYVGLAEYEHNCKLTQKAESPPPTVGQVVFGHVEAKEVTPQNGSEPFTAYKLKKDKKPDFHKAGAVSGVDYNRQLFNGNGGDSRSLRIERQHSQEMAIRVVTRPGVSADLTSMDQFKGSLQHWTDYFCEDLDAYEKARQGLTNNLVSGGPGSGAPLQQSIGQDGSGEPGDTPPAPSLPEPVAAAVADGSLVADDDEIPF